MKKELAETSKNVIAELAGNLPYAGFVILLVELIESLVDQDQLETTLNWIVESKQNGLKIPHNHPTRATIQNWLEEQYKAGTNETSSYAFGYPYSIIIGEKLIQFVTHTNSKYLLPKDGKSGLGTFYPRAITTTTRIRIADQYERGKSAGEMPGDELPILVPSQNAQICDIAISTTKLSGALKLIKPINRTDAESAMYTGREPKKREPVNSWQALTTQLTSQIPELQELFPSTQ